VLSAEGRTPATHTGYGTPAEGEVDEENGEVAAALSTHSKTLDHIVHLTSPGTFHDTAEQFRQLGFKSVASSLTYFTPLIFANPASLMGVPMPMV
jgi:hypothetical protein